MPLTGTAVFAITTFLSKTFIKLKYNIYIFLSKEHIMRIIF